MPDKSHVFDPYLPGNYDFGVLYARVKPFPHGPSWIDGLPHDFRGWGPQTPDPDEADLAPPPVGLQWSGEGEGRDHHVWRFDLRRRSHH